MICDHEVICSSAGAHGDQRLFFDVLMKLSDCGSNSLDRFLRVCRSLPFSPFEKRRVPNDTGKLERPPRTLGAVFNDKIKVTLQAVSGRALYQWSCFYNKQIRNSLLYGLPNINLAKLQPEHRMLRPGLS